jgi:hypothetical protein
MPRRRAGEPSARCRRVLSTRVCRPAAVAVWRARRAHATCVGAVRVDRGNKQQLKLIFETEDGEQGVHWIELPSGKLTDGCKYMRAAAIALGYKPKSGQPLHPTNVFVEKTFRVFAGWRRTPIGGGKPDDRLALTGPKDKGDFLRVHELIELLTP